MRHREAGGNRVQVHVLLKRRVDKFKPRVSWVQDRELLLDP